MSRDAAYITLRGQTAAASAGTTYIYLPIPARFLFEGFSWGYQTAEANTDNTLDFVIARDQDKDGTFDATGDAIHTNANAVGLLDTAALGRMVTNKGDAAAPGGAAVAVTPTSVVIGQDETIRIAVTTAGTGTIPAINFSVYGKFVATRS